MSEAQMLDNGMMIDGQEFALVRKWQDVGRLEGQPVVAFSARFSIKDGNYHTVPTVMYTGTLSVRRYRSNLNKNIIEESYCIYDGIRHHLGNKGWEQQPGKYVVGLSEGEFKARQIHCPKFLYTESII